MGITIIRREELTIKDLYAMKYPERVMKSIKEHVWSKHMAPPISSSIYRVHAEAITSSERVFLTVPRDVVWIETTPNPRVDSV